MKKPSWLKDEDNEFSELGLEVCHELAVYCMFSSLAMAGLVSLNSPNLLNSLLTFVISYLVMAFIFSLVVSSQPDLWK